MNNTTRTILARISRSTGKVYPKVMQAVERMSLEEQLDLNRLLLDLENEQDRAVNNARRTPWRRG